MASNYVEWEVQLRDSRANRPIADSTGVFVVMTVATATKATLYSNAQGTSLTQPGTLANGVARFFTDSSVTSVDFSCLSANGHSVFVRALTPSQHHLDIDPEKITQKLVIPYVHTATLTATIQDTGFDLSAAMMVRDVEIDVVTLSTLGVMNVGTSTTSSGFVVAASIATTGLQALLLQEGAASTDNFYGTLLASTTSTLRKKHIRANATSGANIVYNNVTSAAAQGDGFIYITYDRVPTRG